MNILLSLIIPVYKVEAFIYQCLNSIFSQITENNSIELIIVNDGSPDNSMSIVEELTKDKPHITIVNQQNQGLSVARNTGLSHAKGEYVWFIDSDDWLLPNAIEDVLNYIGQFPEIKVFSSVLEIYEEGKSKSYQEYYPAIAELTGKEYLFKGYKQGASQRFIIKRSFLEDKNLLFCPGILHEDDLFGVKMLYYVPKIIIIDRPLYAYRIRKSGSIMSSVSLRTPQSLITIHKELKTFMHKEVASDDKNKFQKRIHRELYNYFHFSRSIVSTKGFKEQYNKDKSYIKKESVFLLKQLSTFFYGIRMTYFPREVTAIKYSLRKYLYRIQRK